MSGILLPVIQKGMFLFSYKQSLESMELYHEILNFSTGHAEVDLLNKKQLIFYVVSHMKFENQTLICCKDGQHLEENLIFGADSAIANVLKNFKIPPIFIFGNCFVCFIRNELFGEMGVEQTSTKVILECGSMKAIILSSTRPCLVS